MTGLFQAASAGTVARLAAMPDVNARVREAFNCVYGRAPQSDEEAQATALLKAQADKPADATRDLLWALMTSAEFLTMP